ncbi:HNH endonuclease signature motif containing protein [Leucobacter sp. HY1910]
MQHPFSLESPNRGRLNDLVTRVVEVDARMRSLQAELTVLLAEAYKLAEAEGDWPFKPAPGEDDDAGSEGHDAEGVGTAGTEDAAGASSAVEQPAFVPDEAVVRASIAAREAEPGTSGSADDDTGGGTSGDAEAGGNRAVGGTGNTDGNTGNAAGAGGESFGLPAIRLPRGAQVWRDRSYRVVRAEIAAALRVPEGRVGHDMSHAVDAVERCPVMLGALAKGEVTDQHVRGLVNAGRIIGHQAAAQAAAQSSAQADAVTNNDTDSGAAAAAAAAAADETSSGTAALETAAELGDGVTGDGVTAGEVAYDEAAVARVVARRYALLDRALVAHAKRDTAPKVAPTAKRMAEKLAGVTFDDRHQLAKRDRHVRLVELDDGMCQVQAVVTSFEAHVIFDRVTQYAKLLQERDMATGKQAAEAAGTPLSAAAVSALKRPLGEARADSLVALLAHGDLTDEDFYGADVTDADMAGASFGVAGTGRTAERKRLGLRVTARVQVLVPVSLTGRLDGSVAGSAANAGASGSGGTGGTGGTRGVPVAGARAEGPAATSDDTERNARAAELTRGFQPELVGVGPIDTDTAVRILHDTPSWDIITVTDGTGTGASPDTVTDTDTGLPGTIGQTSGGSGTGPTDTTICGSCGTVNSGNTTVGDILAVDSYRVPAHLKRNLAARDTSCRFPGCTLPIYRCDIDHAVAAEDGGPTSLTNVGAACRGHHVIKHHGGCLPVQGDNGDFTWTFPSGRKYRTEPPSRVMFRTALEPADVQALADEHTRKHPFGEHEWDDPGNNSTGGNDETAGEEPGPF